MRIVSILCLIIILLLLAAIHTYAFEPLFYARIDYGAGGPSVFAVDLDGDDDNDLAVANWRSDNVSILINLSNMTGVDNSPETSLPESFSISQNHPNPFNASTIIRYSLPEGGSIKINTYNILGQQVCTLFEGHQWAGTHSIFWQPQNLSSGIYFARLKAGKQSRSIVMMLLE